MKAFLPPVLLLSLLLAVSLGNCLAMVRGTDRWTEQLNQAEALAVSGDWAGASASLQSGYRDWSAHQTYLHIAAEHDTVDGAEAMYRRAEAFAAERELSEFRAETASLRHQLGLLAEMERISAKNIL